ncbi:Ig-like domain-containing protein [Curtobacterium sp. MCLR17_007]|uniref:Ig-like domain-containing protein n=1 Tax=Curtobacterium sp. MCLR17_007 TaxID=2175648 RepID=UPI0024DF916F|nr:Ig-like domain-containing protein [Curtobacterium sp. MCLR17_007]WIB61048.1 Ig-like domain-containing protein [Curtobacterium sp. MCLR17_007]
MSTRGESSGSATVGGGRRGRRPRASLVGALTAALVTGLLALAVVPAAAAAADTTRGTTDTAAAAADTTRGTTDTAPATADTTQPQDQDRAATPAPDPTTAPGDTQADLHVQPTPGAAPTSGSPTPTPPPSGTPAVDPTIADPGDLTSATGRFQGTATPGHRVRVIDPAVTSRSVCTTTTDGDGTWTCSGPVATGPQQVFTVQDLSDASRRTADAPAADVVVPPVISTREPTTGTVVGTGDVGTTVTVSVSGSSAVRTAAVGSDGRWIVSWSTGAAPRPSGTVTMTATATASTADGFRSDLRSAASAPATVTFDRTPPDAPTVTSPRTGDRVAAQALVVRGAGEPRAVLTVYVDRAPVCGATVRADGSWACSTSGGPLTVGAHVVTALQHDAAGNHSPSSTPVTVDVVATTPGSTVSPSGSPGSGSATGGSSGPATGGTGGPTTGTVPGSGGPGSSAGGTTDGTGTGTGDASGGATAGGRPGVDWSGPAGDWSVATSFGRTVPTIQAAASWDTLAVAGAVAVGFLLLVAGPARLVARTLRGRVTLRLGSFTGRNRPRSERRRGDDALPAWASVSIAVVLASVLTLLGVGVSLEARYVRLAIAVLLGTGVLAAAVVIATRWAAGADRHTVGFRVSPWLVLAALVACAVTRAADLSPALVLGVLLVPVGRTDVDTGAMRLGAGVAACARSATWRSCALLVLAATGWLLHSVTTGPGFWTALVSEFAITLCVGGLGSLVATLLPLAGSAGSALWSRSRTRYAAVATVGVALGAAVYSGPGGTHVSPVALALIACVCVAAALGTWLWVRTADADSARA